MTYDAFGNMVEQDVYTASTGETTVTKFVWSGGNVYADLTAATRCKCGGCTTAWIRWWRG